MGVEVKGCRVVDVVFEVVGVDFLDVVAGRVDVLSGGEVFVKDDDLGLGVVLESHEDRFLKAAAVAVFDDGLEDGVFRLTLGAEL